MGMWANIPHLRQAAEMAQGRGKIPRVLSLCASLALATLMLGAAVLSSASAGEGERLAQNTLWDKSHSPYLIEQDLLIPAGIQLSVKPGVQVRFARGASLLIEGEISACGTAADPIIFTSASDNPTPGDWGNLRFITADTTLSYEESGQFLKGSRLEYCLIEYGGQPAKGTSKEFLGGAIHCRKSSPYLKNLTLRYNRSVCGGGIYCHEFASPYIEDCLFLENEAKETGGGLACFFYANPVVKHNVFQANRAGEHGGGIYFSFSSPQIMDNIIENNRAKYQGGGLYGSNTVTRSISRVRNNALLSNQSEQGGNNIFVTAKIETIFQENCLFAENGYDVYIEALESDLDLRGNYFGPLEAGDLEARTRDRYDDPAQKAIICDPVLEAPPLNAPNAPGNITSFELRGDADFATDWPFPLCARAPIYLEVKAEDQNPYHADWIPLRLRSSESDSRGVVALAWETGPSTGIFRLKGEVSSPSSAKQATIRAQAGEILFFSIEGKEGFEITRRMEAPKSYIVAFGLPEEADSLHVVHHQPVAAWQFRNIFGWPQKSYQLQLSSGSAFAAPPLWESGERSDKEARALIQGADLQDGAVYALRLRMNSGAEWSDWADLTLRMNSLPTMPQLQAPLGDQVVSRMHPEITLLASQDAEGDLVTYELQLYQDAAFTRVLALEKELHGIGATAKWVPGIELKDDAEYYWRARARDGYETGEWAPAGHFYVNTVEEPPLPFALIDPESGLQVYKLQPVFSWNKTIDPDPLSKVHYRLLLSPEDKFLPASTIKLETEQTFLKVDRALKNDAAYFWKVEAVDNTGRFTPSEQTGHFTVSTTPTVPQLAGPLQGEELRPEAVLNWTKSHDPDPEDRVQYRLQMAEKDFSKPLFEEIAADNSLALAALQNLALLTDDREYRFRVRAEDSQGSSSAWSKETGSFFYNKVNTPPAAITGSITPDGLVVAATDPTFSWGAASDADRSDPASTLSYFIQFDQEGSFKQVARQVQVMAGITQIAVPGLADNSKWYYRICARDDEGAVSAYSPIKSFTLNTRNDPPAPFALTGPDNGWNTFKLSGIDLGWQASTDIDPGDRVHYRLYLSESGAATPQLEGRRVEGTTFKLTQTLKNEVEYQWWVEAEDSLGARTASQGRYLFTVNTTPAVPQAAEIVGGILHNNSLFQWQPSTDPDPTDQLTYDLEIFSPDNPQASLAKLQKILPAKAGTGLTVPELKGLKTLKDNQTYAYRVRAVDSHNAASAWCAPLGFSLDLQNEPSTAPSLIQPTVGMVRSTDLTVEWVAAADPDPTDKPEKITYRLQAVQGENFSLGKSQEYIIPSGGLSMADLNLADNQLWSLRVRAEDARGGISPWSAPIKVVVNMLEDPPGVPEIRSPAIGTVLTAPAPVVLAWKAVQDPDYRSSVIYELSWWPADKPEKTAKQGELKLTSFKLPGLLESAAYQWQVTAVDETGLKSTSAVGSFTYKSAISNTGDANLR